jgi:hypothetical protein
MCTSTTSRSLLPWIARIGVRGHAEHVVTTGTPGGTHILAALRHEGIAAAAGKGLGFCLGRPESVRR